MNNEVEIEYKTIVTLEEYKKLIKHFDLVEKTPIKQTNYYFETKDDFIKSLMDSLRIRKISNTYTVTYKKHVSNNKVIELNNNITSEEFNKYMSNGINLKEYNNSNKTAFNISSLTTERFEISNNNIKYFIDKSTYNGITDYEIEIETTKELNNSEISTIFSKLDIIYKKSVPKVVRCFNTINKKD